jgi:hypothetical protein
VLDKRDITSDLKNGLQCQRILKLERIWGRLFHAFKDLGRKNGD